MLTICLWPVELISVKIIMFLSSGWIREWAELKWKLAHEPKIYLLHFLNQEKKFWSSYVFFAPVTLNSLFKKAKIMLMRTRLAKVDGAHAPLSSRTSSRDSYVVVWILQPLMYLDWISFLFRFTFLLAAPQISFDFWKCETVSIYISGRDNDIINCRRQARKAKVWPWIRTKKDEIAYHTVRTEKTRLVGDLSYLWVQKGGE